MRDVSRRHRTTPPARRRGTHLCGTGPRSHDHSSSPVEIAADPLRSATTDAERTCQRARADRLAAVGEPLFSYFTPDGIAAQLRVLGFTDTEDHTAPDLIAGYPGGSAEFEGEPSPALHAIRMLRASR